MKKLHIGAAARAALLALVAGVAAPRDASAAMIEVARYAFTGGSPASTDGDAATTAGDWIAADLGTTVIGGTPSTNSGLSTGGSPTGNGAAFVRGVAVPLATTTASNINPASDISFHEFSLTVNGLLPNEELNLTNIAYDRRADTQSRGWVEVYSDLTGYTIPNRLVQSFSFSNTFVTQSFSLASITLLSGLSNGDAVNFRLYFSSTNNTNSANVQRVDNLVLTGEVVTVPEPAALSILALGGVACLLRRRAS